MSGTKKKGEGEESADKEGTIVVILAVLFEHFVSPSCKRNNRRGISMKQQFSIIHCIHH